MKKLLIVSLISLVLLNCGDEVEFNSPAFQGNMEGRLWRAASYSASIDANGFLTLTGRKNRETVNLRVPSVVETTFIVGDVNSMEAEFIDSQDVQYTTNNRPDPTVSVYPEYGEIIIEEIDYTNSTFTGKFRFLAFNTSGLNSVNFINGVFFKVPLVSGTFPANPIMCSDTQADVETRRLALETILAASPASFVSSSAYLTSCNDYRDALIRQRNYCGDVNSSIQNTITNLGSCQLPCSIALANRNLAQTQYNAATVETYVALCAQYQLYLQEQITFCGDPMGSIQATLDNLNCDDNDGDGVANVYEDFNGNGNFDDDDSDFDGTPNYLDTDDDGDGILTSFEITLGDTDGNGAANYIDNDDDGDGTLTAMENADPNGDGNPADAVDTDGNGTPDYLQI